MSAPVITGQMKVGGSFTRTFNILRGGDPSGIDMDVPGTLNSGGSGGPLFIKNGDGVMRLARETLTYTFAYRGFFVINGGTLLVNSNITCNSQPGGSDLIVVSNTATLGGIGTINLREDVYYTNFFRCRFDAGSTFAPGSLGVGTFTFLGTGSVVHCEGTAANPSVFAFELASASSYDVLRNQGTLMLTGTNNVGNCRLNITRLGGYTPASTDKFFLVENYGNYPTVGTFANADTGGGLIDIGSNWVGRIGYSGKKSTGALSGGYDIVLYAVAPRVGKGMTVFFR